VPFKPQSSLLLLCRRQAKSPGLQNGTQAKALKYISKMGRLAGSKKQTRTFASIDQKPKPENPTKLCRRRSCIVAMATSLL